MGNPFVQKQPDINQLYQQFMQNPLQFLQGFNIPTNLTNPQQIVEYLADSGKIPPMLKNRVDAMLGRR